MSGDANEAVRLKEKEDAKRGIDADSTEANNPGAEPADPADTESERADPSDDGTRFADKIMPSSDKPRPAHD